MLIKSKIKEDQGSTLVIVLWTVSILSILAIAAGFQVWVEAKLTAFQYDKAKEKRLCVASIEIAKQILQKDPTPTVDLLNEPWGNFAEQFDSILLDEGKVSVCRTILNDLAEPIDLYGLEDEESKLNLNRATLKMIQSLPGMTDEAAACIIDWRDADSTLSPGGSEDSYYQSLAHSYHCKNSVLESMEELLLVRGMNNDIYQKIRPFTTVYGEGKVNINTAPKEVLLALGLNENVVKKIVRYRRGEDDKEATEDDRAFPKTHEIVKNLNSVYVLAPDEGASLQNLVTQNLFSVGSVFFRLHLVVNVRETSVPSKYEILLQSKPDKKEWFIKHWARII